ncbi:hypothetical protein [Arthrobacter psychrolactophilus]
MQRFKRHCTEEQIERAIANSPAAAGIPLKVIAEVANTSIAYETSKVTGLSTLAGIPGGLAMLGTVPADLAQYMGHMLRIAQKLAYIYSWPDLFADDGEDIDEATESMLILFVGVMFGVQIAQGGVAKVAGMIAANVAKKLPQQALTKGIIYPIVKKVAGHLGVSMTKKLFASGIAKAIPVVGAVLSGGLTLGTFLPMSKRLQKHLASLELTKPGHRPKKPRTPTLKSSIGRLPWNSQRNSRMVRADRGPESHRTTRNRSGRSRRNCLSTAGPVQRP